MNKESTCSKETQEIWIQPLGREDALEEEMATHSTILAWKIPWTEAWRATVLGVAKSQNLGADNSQPRS